MMMNISYITIANTYKTNGKLIESLLKPKLKNNHKITMKRKMSIMMIICLAMKLQQKLIITTITTITTLATITTIILIIQTIKIIVQKNKKNMNLHYINQEILKH